MRSTFILRAYITANFNLCLSSNITVFIQLFSSPIDFSVEYMSSNQYELIAAQSQLSGLKISKRFFLFSITDEKFYKKKRINLYKELHAVVLMKSMRAVTSQSPEVEHFWDIPP